MLNLICSSLGVEILKVIPVLVVGLIAANIAREQKEIAHAKLKLDLFEKRILFFNTTKALVDSSKDLTNEESINECSEKLFKMYQESTFLFDNDIKKLMSDVHRNVGVLAGVVIESLQGNGKASSDSLAKGIAAKEWLQNVDLVTPFKPYLDLSKWK